jgi:hypothetical protein
MFLRSANSMAISRRLHLETGSQKLKMAVTNRKYLYVSFCLDSEEISEDSPMFSEAGNSMVILVLHYLEIGSQIFKMAAQNRKYLYLTFCAR